MRILISLLAGIIFGVGLTIADMTNPAKVQNFLDIAGTWDPSLVFVMAAATVVALVGFRFVQARSRPLFGEAFVMPAARTIDARLVGGSALFGIGWGLSGFCPGPAIAGIAWGDPSTLLFVAAMVAGMVVGNRLEPRPAPSAAPAG